MKGFELMGLNVVGAKAAKTFGVAVAGALVDKAVEKGPGMIERITKKKEEKNFFEENKIWIFMIILSIFVTNLSYINMFKNVILNSIINIIFGIIIFVLLYLFFKEQKNLFKINSKFIKTLIVSLIILGSINSFYHIGYAVGNLFGFI